DTRRVAVGWRRSTRDHRTIASPRGGRGHRAPDGKAIRSRATCATGGSRKWASRQGNAGGAILRLAPRQPRAHSRAAEAVTPADHSAAVCIRGLSKAYGQTQAVRELDLDVGYGEIFAI